MNFQTFQLINEQTRIQDPNDISYVYNGYSPLSVKFIETMFFKGGFAKLDKEDSKKLLLSYLVIELKILPGPSEFPPNESDFFSNKNVPVGQALDSKKSKVLVYYIGGITYGEIAAIRFLNKLFSDRKFIIATTQIINGDACVEMLRGQINNRLDHRSILQK